jgi:sialate O-acetylesterase
LAGKPEPSRPRAPRNPLTGQHRPANLYNGVLKPIIGYGIKGTIWYQGESNSGRAKAYRDIFPLMIKNWRDEWSQGNFPFYWVQLADFREESPAPADSNWAELREAQTLTLSQPNTGQAVITDLGEAHDIHPKDKQNVAKRLARWALAKDYGFNDLVYRSPQYKAHQRNGKKIILHFDFVGGGLDTFDIRTPLGFTLAGEDKVFHPAVAKIVGKDQVEVSSDNVQNPVAARYAWADNPVANVQNKEGLPLTPFRTDDFPMVTDGF